MGISLKNRRQRGNRRSYADYRPPSRNSGPRLDIFMLLFSAAVIAGVVWGYYNRDTVVSFVMDIVQPETDETAGNDLPDGEDSADPDGAGDSDSTETIDVLAAADEAYRAGNLNSAIDYYKQAVELFPGDARNYVEIARLLVYRSSLEFGDKYDRTLEEAFEAANMATVIAPYDPAGYAIMGKVYDWQGFPEKAVVQLLQSSDLDQGYALAYSYLAEAYVDMDLWVDANTTIERALEISPNDIDVRRDYAYVLEYQGYYLDAATQYEAALQIHPNLNPVRVSLGRVYVVLGRYEEALDQFLEVQSREPSSPVVMFEIGRTYESAIGDPNTALEYYQRAVDLDDDYGRAWLRIGTLNYFQGRYAEAILALEKALALETIQNDIYYQLGLSYAYDGRCTEALRYLNEAQENAEDDERILDAVQVGYEICSQPASPGG